MRTVRWRQFMGHLQVQREKSDLTICGLFHSVAARFHVKQPPPATGLRVIYSPGPVSFHFDV